MSDLLINFERIRAHDGSKTAAWEELSFLLARDLDDLPVGARLDRRGTPDGGVEFTCAAPEGDGLWGWQAKYLFQYDADTIRQMRKSFKDALAHHPDLVRYIYVLPSNPPDGAVGESGYKKWLSLKSELEAYASEHGAVVDLVLHGRSDVMKALLREEHSGVARYFFDIDFPTGTALARQVERAVKDLGDRYDADLHVDTEFPRVVEALCLSDSYVSEVAVGVLSALSAVRAAGRAMVAPPTSRAVDAPKGGWSPIVSAETVTAISAAAYGLEDKLQAVLPALEARDPQGYPVAVRALDACEAALSQARDQLRLQADSPRAVERFGDLHFEVDSDAGSDASYDTDEADRPDGELSTDLRGEVGDRELLERMQLEQARANATENAEGSRRRDGARILEQAQVAVAAAHDLVRGQRADAALRKSLLVVGSAGCGKSHTIADVASSRAKAGIPTVLILGGHLNAQGRLTDQLESALGLDIGWSDLLAGLSTAAKVAGHGRALIAIDAINEGGGADLWGERLAGLLTKIAEYPMIALVVTVRDTYVRTVIPDSARGLYVRFDHPGLARHEHEAVALYAAHYGLTVPAMPPLAPEFTNPLLLRTMCRAARQRGLTAIPMAAMGEEWIFGGLMDAVNAAISAPKVLDCDLDEQVAQRAIKVLAAAMVDAGRDSITVSEARKLCRGVFDNGAGASRSLFNALEQQGILLRQPGRANKRVSGHAPWTVTEEAVQFTFQRMSDYLRAQVLLDRHQNQTDLVAAITTLMTHARWSASGILEALAALVPEQHGVELVDLVAQEPWVGGYDHEFAVGLLSSLMRRTPQTVTVRTVELLEKFDADTLEEGDWLGALVALATVPDHPLSIEFLDRRLRGLSLIERDRRWTVVVAALWATDENPLARTIDWLWGTERRLDDVTAKQVAYLMSWLLTSTSRRLRDSATKVLIETTDARTGLLTDLLNNFVDINDPYVRERLLAASFGHLSRMPVDSTSANAAAEIVELCGASVRLAEASRPNISVTHYTLAVLREARTRLPDAALPSFAQAATVWPLVVPEAVDLARRLGEPGDTRLLGSPLGSDFKKYVLERGTCHDFVPPGQDVLRQGRSDRATARYEKAVAELADATGRSVGEIKTILAERTAPHRIRDYMAAVRQTPEPAERTTAAPLSIVETEPVVSELDPGYATTSTSSSDVSQTDDNATHDDKVGDEAGNEVDVADLLAVYRGRQSRRPPTPLDELRTTHPDLTQSAEQADRERRTRGPVRFDPQLLEHWITGRVLDLGWKPQALGGPYDRPWAYAPVRGSGDKIERIGKKYSWIAHQELLAVLTEHAQRVDWDGRMTTGGSTWDLPHVNDIDPTVTLRADQPPAESASGRLAARARRTNAEAWWRTGWESPLTKSSAPVGTWLHSDLDLPESRRLMVRTDLDGDEWLVLESHVQWRADRPGAQPGMEPHRRDMWIRTHSYLAASSSVEDLRTWSDGQDWMGLWMPTPPDYGLGYLRGYPHDEPWASWYVQSRIERATTADNDDRNEDDRRSTGKVGTRSAPEGSTNFTTEQGWDVPSGHAYPEHPVALTTYGSTTAAESDMSNRSGPSCPLPSPKLLLVLDAFITPAGEPDLLGLGPVEKANRWSNIDGVVMFGTDGWDSDAPQALLVRLTVLQKALAGAGLTWWSWILGEKIVWEHGEPTPERMNMFGANGLGDRGWEEWSLSHRYHDYSEDGDTAHPDE